MFDRSISIKILLCAVATGFTIIYLFSIFLIKESNHIYRLSFVFNNDIFVCSNSLKIFSKSAFLFDLGVYLYVISNLAN